MSEQEIIDAGYFEIPRQIVGEISIMKIQDVNKEERGELADVYYRIFLRDNKNGNQNLIAPAWREKPYEPIWDEKIITPEESLERVYRWFDNPNYHAFVVTGQNQAGERLVLGAIAIVQLNSDSQRNLSKYLGIDFQPEISVDSNTQPVLAVADIFRLPIINENGQPIKGIARQLQDFGIVQSMKEINAEHATVFATTNNEKMVGIWEEMGWARLEIQGQNYKNLQYMYYSNY